LLALGRVGAAQVPAHPVRVGADDEQVTARARVAMPGARWQHEDIAALDREAAPAGAAEDDRGAAGHDAEDLVRRGVKVVEGEDAVHPGAKPAVPGQQLLALTRLAGAFDLVVDEHRQPRVRDPARVLEAVRLGPSHGRQFYPLDSSIVPLA